MTNVAPARNWYENVSIAIAGKRSYVDLEATLATKRTSRFVTGESKVWALRSSPISSWQ